jgi:hypothetical protein
MNTQELLSLLAKAYNQIDYYDFLFRTGFKDCTYAMEKFQSFQLGCKKLLEFDPDTLQSIITLSVKDEQTKKTVGTSERN